MAQIKLSITALRLGKVQVPDDDLPVDDSVHCGHSGRAGLEEV